MARWPGTPASSGTTTSSATEDRLDSLTAGRDEAAKRPRACDGCRAAKVRCVPPSPDAPGSSCPRCVRAGKACITSPAAGSRKKRKKAVNRVLELEKKMDRLTASLCARNGGQALAFEGPESSGTAARKGIMAGSASADKDEDEEDEAMTEGGEDTISTHTPTTACGENGAIVTDIVRPRLLSTAEADKLLVRYNTQMVHHSPLVVFNNDLSAARLRETRPTVFLAVMAAASYDTPALQRKLVGELTRAFAEKIIVAAEKSLELIQALQISITWTWLPDYFEELQFYQQVHISTAMAVELGLGRRLPQKRATPYGNHAFQRKNQGSQATTSIDPTSLEARRAWLACYYLSSTMTIMKRRPLLLTWTRFMAESCELLRTAPDRAPTDEDLCAHVWAHRLSEDVAQQIAGDDFDDPANATRLVFSLRKVDRDLSQFQRSFPDGFVRETLAITFGVVPLYLYGVALHCDLIDGKQEEQRPSQPSPSPAALPSITLPDAVTLSTANISTITSCLLNIRAVTEAFLTMTADTMRCLPTINYGRVVLACAMLFKLYIFVDQDSDIAAVIEKDQFGVGPCIDRLIRQFHAAAAGRCCRPASRLLAVLFVIKDSFIAYCARQGSEDRPKTKDQASRPSQYPPSQSSPTSRQEWPSQQPLQHPHRQPAPQAFEQGSTVASALPEFSGAPWQSCTTGAGLPPWDDSFFAALSVEEFSYSLGANAEGEGLADYYAASGNDLSPDVNMHQDHLRDVELANMPSSSNGLAGTSWERPMRFE